MISDIVPNPFVGREIVGRFLTVLDKRGFSEAKIGSLSSLIVEELRKGLDAERAARAEAMFKADVAAGRIQFRLRLDGKNWRMSFTIETAEPVTAHQLVGASGGPLERSLFAPVYEADFNGDEREIAVYLDGEKALVWWHRNVARVQYGMQGWRRAKVYPDFIFAVRRSDKSRRVTVLETKADQLDNLDAAYKRDLLDFLSTSFAWDTKVPAGTLELIKNTGETVECSLILMSEWRAKLPAHLTP
jgi:type III restriction enzyme